VSWARVDDGLWEHPKFEALRDGHAYSAIALWVLAISHAGRKQHPRITVLEAMMLLACDREDAARACESLLAVGLFDEDSASKCLPSTQSGCFEFASKQSRSYRIHDWDNYRSKDEARASAGRKGGKKSAESRRRKIEAKSKQSPSKREANAKHPPSPDPDPDPVPDPVPDPDTVSSSLSDLVSMTQVEQRFDSWGWSTYMSPQVIKRISGLLPVSGSDAEHARGVTAERGVVSKPGYWAGTIEGMRSDAEKPVRSHRPARRSGPPTRAELAAIVFDDEEESGS